MAPSHPRLPPLDSRPAGDLLTIPETAEYLRVSPAVLESWRREARREGPPFIRLGKGRRSPIRYRVDALREWLAANTHVPGEGGDSPAQVA